MEGRLVLSEIVFVYWDFSSKDPIFPRLPASFVSRFLKDTCWNYCRYLLHFVQFRDTACGNCHTFLEAFLFKEDHDHVRNAAEVRTEMEGTCIVRDGGRVSKRVYCEGRTRGRKRSVRYGQ